MKLIVNGAMGRMGQAVIAEANRSNDFELFGLIESPLSKVTGIYLDKLLGSEYPHVRVMEGWQESFQQADILIDFSLPDGTMRILPYLQEFGISLVCGTTGLSDGDWQELIEASRKTAIFYSPNMSVGMFVMSRALKIIAEELPQSWDSELIEIHHRMKKDSPSGTAFKLSQLLSDIRTKTGGVSPGGTGIHSLRMGDVTGRHVALFAGPGEVLELSHAAHSRTVFASGSLTAARFMKDKRSGLYGMDDLFSGGK